MRRISYLFLLFALLACTACTRNVKDYDLTLSFQNQSLTGKYTGQLVDNIAVSDSAEFTYKDGDKYLNYTGGFKDGQFNGNGHLETNFYTAHFSDVDRTGEYKGDVVDSVPKGQGEFTATNDEGNTYTYKGEWAEGTFNGQGIRSWKDNKFLAETGRFTNGDFNPTKIEWLQLNGEDDPNAESEDGEYVFTITNKAYEFIKNNTNMFPTSTFETIKNKVDTTIQYKHIMKNANNYGDKLIKCSGYVAINEYDTGYDDIGTVTVLQVFNYENSDFFYTFYFGKLDGIYDNDRVVVYGLPISTTSFTNVSKTTTQAVVLLGSYVVKQ